VDVLVDVAIVIDDVVILDLEVEAACGLNVHSSVSRAIAQEGDNPASLIDLVSSSPSLAPPGVDKLEHL